MKPILSLFFALAFNFVYAQTDSTNTDVYDLSLEELMNIKITASKTNLSSRETPSIVSVITGEDIKNMGARDLMDVLNQVPGFNFASDVQNVVGLGARGNWGHEGKILLLIDGNEMNEILYATTQFGQHYDISNIDKIEIIRGPGSSIYGGYAELGVINIITKTGQQQKAATVGGLYGQVSGASSRRNIRASVGSGTEKLNYSFSGLYGEGIRSNKTYEDIYGNTTNMKKTSTLRPMMINGNLNAGQFSLSMIYDGFHSKTADQLTEILSPVDKVSFNNFYTTAKYNAKFGDKLTVTPRVNFKTGSPWKTIDTSPIPYSLKATRFAPGINASYNPLENVNLVFGVDSYFDHAEYTGSGTDYFSSLGKGNSVSFHNIGVFAQGVFKTSLANFTLGARLDNHSQFGSAFSPRLGITRAWPSFHLKALYSRAFRSPSIENLNYTPNIKPEKTGVAELELGYKINDNMFVTGNGYYIVITDPIVYTVDNGSQVYKNSNQAGSIGFELDYRIKYGWGYISTNYSYYSSQNINKVPDYQTESNDNIVLGLPGSRLNLLASIKLTSIFTINPSMNIFSKRFGQDNYDVTPQIFGNLFVRAKFKNIDGGLGAYNIFDQRQYFIQPYSGGHAPLPGLGREFVINVQYSIPFK